MKLQSKGLLILAVLVTAQALSLPPLPSFPMPSIPEFPPWVWIGMVFNGANTIQTAKKTAGLLWRWVYIRPICSGIVTALFLACTLS